MQPAWVPGKQERTGLGGDWVGVPASTCLAEASCSHHVVLMVLPLLRRITGCNGQGNGIAGCNGQGNGHRRPQGTAVKFTRDDAIYGIRCYRMRRQQQWQGLGMKTTSKQQPLPIILGSDTHSALRSLSCADFFFGPPDDAGLAKTHNWLEPGVANTYTSVCQYADVQNATVPQLQVGTLAA